MLKRFLLGLLVISLVWSCGKTAMADDGTITVSVLSFNDLHGALTENGPNDKNMGASKLVTAINRYKVANPDTLVVAAGDNYNGTALSNLLYGKPVSDMMMVAGVKLSAIGNHEFDWGIDKIISWTTDGGFDFVAANILSKGTRKPVEWAKPYVILETESGVKVAFVGLTTQETAFKTNPHYVEDLIFDDYVKSAKPSVAEARKKGADIVVLLTHIASWQDEEGNITLEPNAMALTEIPGVNAIITAHSHQQVAGLLNGVPIVQAYYNGRSLGVLNFTVGNNSHTLLASTVELDNLFTHKADFEDNVEMSAIIAAHQTEVAPVLNEIIGQLPTALPHDRYMLSPLGQWTAEVMRKAGEANIAFTNGGGLRTNLPAGNITMGNLYEVMPFDNMLSIFTMTGAQIKEVLEHGINNTDIGDVQYAGIKVVADGSKPKGQKVINITLSNGDPLVDNQNYRVVTNDFMAAGGDGFTSFLQAEYLGDTISIRDAMRDAITG